MKTRFRLREYLHQSVHMKNAQTQKRILSQLSPALHSEARAPPPAAPSLQPQPPAL